MPGGKAAGRVSRCVIMAAGMGVKRILGWLALLLGVAGVYYLLLPVSYNFDGTVFAHYLRYAVVRGDLLAVLQFHHLLYFPLAYGAYEALLHLFSFRPLEYHFLQGVSLFFALASLAVIGYMLRKSVRDTFYAWAGTLVVACSYAFWLMAVEAEVHMAGFFFVAAGMALLLADDIRPGRAVVAACLLALGCGFHLTNGLAFVAAAAMLWRQRARGRSWAGFLAAAALGLAVPLLLYSWSSGKSVSGFFRNALAGADVYAGYHISYWPPLSPRAAWGALAALKNAVCSAAVWPVAGWLLFLIILAVMAAMFWRVRAKALPFLFWLVPYLVFFSCWDAANIEFKLSIVVPLLLLFVIAWSELLPGGNGRAFFLLFVVVLFSVNLRFGMAPQSDIRRNGDFQIARAITERTGRDALIVIGGNFSGYGYGKIYIPYFAQRQVLILDWLLGKGQNLDTVAADIRRELGRGREVCFLDEIVSAGSARRQLLGQHGIGAGEYDAFLGKFSFSSPRALSAGHWLVRVQPRGQ